MLDSNVTVILDNNVIFVNDTLKINGTLYSSFSNDTVNPYTLVISGGELNITVNGVLVNTTVTDENGY